MIEKIVGMIMVVAIVAIESAIVAYVTGVTFLLVFGVSFGLFVVSTLCIVAVVTLITKQR